MFFTSRDPFERNLPPVEKGYLQEFKAAVKRNDSSTAIRAAQALGQSHDEASFQLLLNYAKDPRHIEYKSCAVTGLLSSSHRSVVDELVKLALDPWAVNELSLCVVEAATPTAAVCCRRMLSSGDLRFDRIVNSGSDYVKSFLAEEILRGDYVVDRYAMRTYIEWAIEHRMPEDPDTACRAALQGILSRRLDAKKASELIVERSRELNRIKGLQLAMDTLDTACRSEDPDVQKVAAKLLRMFGTNDVWQEVLSREYPVVGKSTSAWPFSLFKEAPSSETKARVLFNAFASTDPQGADYDLNDIAKGQSLESWVKVIMLASKQGEQVLGYSNHPVAASLLLMEAVRDSEMRKAIREIALKVCDPFNVKLINSQPRGWRYLAHLEEQLQSNPAMDKGRSIEQIPSDLRPSPRTFLNAGFRFGTLRRDYCVNVVLPDKWSLVAVASRKDDSPGFLIVDEDNVIRGRIVYGGYTFGTEFTELWRDGIPSKSARKWLGGLLIDDDDGSPGSGLSVLLPIPNPEKREKEDQEAVRKRKEKEAQEQHERAQRAPQEAVNRQQYFGIELCPLSVIIRRQKHRYRQSDWWDDELGPRQGQGY